MANQTPDRNQKLLPMGARQRSRPNQTTPLPRKQRRILMPKMEDIASITGYYRESIRSHDDPEVITFSDGLDNLIKELVSPRKDRKSTRLNSSHVAISYAVF